MASGWAPIWGRARAVRIGQFGLCGLCGRVRRLGRGPAPTVLRSAGRFTGAHLGRRDGLADRLQAGRTLHLVRPVPGRSSGPAGGTGAIMGNRRGLGRLIRPGAGARRSGGGRCPARCLERRRTLTRGDRGWIARAHPCPRSSSIADAPAPAAEPANPTDIVVCPHCRDPGRRRRRRRRRIGPRGVGGSASRATVGKRIGTP